MSPLMNTITTGTAQLIEAPILIGAAFIAFGVRIAPSGKSRKSRPTSIDGHTMTDIGLERGSITWMH